jgi:hypothetical protein
MGLMNLAVAIPNAAAPSSPRRSWPKGWDMPVSTSSRPGLTLTGAVLIVKVKGVR